MPKVRFHKLAALVVLVGFAAWVATGEFSSVGSAADPQKQEAAGKQEAEVKAPVRTVAVVKPPRAIRISGVTEADKRACWRHASAASSPGCRCGRASTSRRAT